MRESSSAKPASGSTGRGLRSRGGAAGGESGAAVTGGSLSPGQWIGSSTPVGGRCGRGADSVRSAGSTRGVASGFGAGSGCSGHMVSSPSGTARGSVSVAVAGRPGANVAPAARTMFCSITTSVGPPMMRRCSTLSRRMRIEPAAVVDRRLVDHGKPRLAAARCRTAQPPAAEPAQQPERQREQAQHHHQEQQNFRTGLSFAEQGIQDHSSLRPRGVACRSGSPEWLTPLAISVAMNTNKELR